MKSHSDNQKNHFEGAALLKERQAAELLDFSPRALQNWRTRGGGPKYVKVSSRSVRYRMGDLLDWAEKRIRSNSAEDTS